MDDLVAGRYQLVRTLGRGGMGEVVLARQLALDKLVVLKRADAKSQRNQRALLDEAKIAARLNHPNIVSVLEVIDGLDQSVVVMEFVVGVTVRELIEAASDGLPPEIALAIAVDVLRGLGYAHAVRRGDAVGVIHRDVKPRNLMVTFAGVSKLIDFGISRWLDDSGGWEATSVSGTRGYMAPEQLESARVDGRADQYALGITLAEMLSGAPPVDDTGDPARKPRAIDPLLAAIVERATSPVAEHRFASCADMISAIESYASAATLALSATAVERYVSTRFAERKAELERAAEQRLPRPPTAPTVAFAGGVRGSDRIALDGKLRFAARAAEGTDQVFGPVCERLLRHYLLHSAVRRFHVVDRDPAQRIELTCTRTDIGFTVDARVGTTAIASGVGPAILDAVAMLGDTLIELADRLPELGADDGELAAMHALGTDSWEAYRCYRRALASYTVNLTQDVGALISEVENAIELDPGWAHPHALLAILHGMSTPDAAATLAAARVACDRSRDPSGCKIIDALAARQLGVDVLAAAFRANPDDLLVGAQLVPTAAANQQLDDAGAVARKLHERYPDTLFGGDLAECFSRGGREVEAERVIRDWVDRCPENIGAVLELARVEATAANFPQAMRHARNAVAIHGEQPDNLTLLFEVYVLADDFTAAQRIADRMLLGSDLDRARGRYRNAVIAVLGGRFSAAHASIRRAIEENRPFGWQSELAQSLSLATSTARILGDAAALRRYSAEVATTLESLVEVAEAVRARYDASLDTPTPLAIDDVLAALDDGSIRDAARVMLVRSAALAGIVPARDAVAAGFSDNEKAPGSLVALGICARREGELAMARRSFERAIKLWSPLLTNEASPYHAMLGRYHLASLLVELGQPADARRHYEAFLRGWGNADRPIPEVSAARKELAGL